MTSRIANKILVELFTGKKRILATFVFGSKIYSLISNKNAGNGMTRLKKMYLLVTTEFKSYSILDPNTKRIWISCSVRIIEHDANQSSCIRIYKEKRHRIMKWRRLIAKCQRQFTKMQEENLRATRLMRNIVIDYTRNTRQTGNRNARK